MGKDFGHATAQAATPMEAAYDIIEQENRELKNDIRELEARLQAVSQEFRANEQECERKYQELLFEVQAKCKQTIEETRQHIDTMQRELVAERERANGLQKQLGAEQAVAMKLRQDISTGQKNAKVMQENRDAEKLRADGLQKQWRAEKDRADKLQTDLATEKKNTSELRQKANQLPKLQGQITELENTERSLRVQLTDKNKKMRRRAAGFVLLFIIACLPSVYFYFQIQEYQSESRFLSQQADRLRGEVTSLTEDMESLQASYGSTEEENTALKAELAAWEAELAALEAENSALESENSSVRKENSALSEKLTSLQADYKKIQPEYAFYHEHAVIVYNDDTKLYHQYGCSKGNYWIYNLELAKDKDYTPCPKCLRSVYQLF